jgi:hypothetical protein
MGGLGTRNTLATAYGGSPRSRILPNQLGQAFDAVVVDGALRLRGGPLDAHAFLAEHHHAKIPPAGETLFPGEDKLRIAQR